MHSFLAMYELYDILISS